jgi:hypothetical protein
VSISGFGRPARFEGLDYPIDSGDPYDLRSVDGHVNAETGPLTDNST